MTGETTQLIELAVKNTLELRIHVNPQWDEDTSLYHYIGNLLDNKEISNEIAAMCIKENTLITMKVWPKNDTDDYFYAHGPYMEECAQVLLGKLESHK